MDTLEDIQIRNNSSLIRHGRVFDTYISDDNCEVIKKLVMKNKKGFLLFNNELEILKIISLDYKKNFCNLMKLGIDYFSVSYIPHKKLDERVLYEILEKKSELSRSLAESLAGFNSLNIINNKVINKDTLFIRYIKSLIKVLLMKDIKLSKQTIVELIGIIIFIFKYRRSNIPILTHNDFREGNILVSEDEENIFIIDYDRSTTAYNFLSRDALQLCTHSDTLYDWSWQYEYLAEYIYFMKNNSIEFYNLIIDEMKDSVVMRKYFFIRAVMDINVKGNLKEIALKNLEILKDNSKFIDWHMNFINYLNI